MPLDAAKRDQADGRGPRIGTAGWSLPSAVRDQFPAGESLLASYALGFDCVEINSAFYRSHQRKTYQRWAASTPARFRFAVKTPREITHTRRLVDAAEPLDRFLEEIKGLDDKLGPILIQLPPSLRFEPAVAAGFMAVLRKRFDGLAALEARHTGWFTPDAEALLIQHRIARVAADPAVVPAAATPGGWEGFQYHRLHGSPKLYESAYDSDVLTALAADLSPSVWVVFDNTKFGAATENALQLQAISARRRADLVPEPPHAR